MDDVRGKMLDLREKKICVTGGGGFVGSFVVETLRHRGCREIFVPRRCDYDLTTAQGIAAALGDSRPDVLFHLAAVVGGIEANLREPGRLFYENAVMGIQLIEYARRFGVGKVVVAGTVCAYPKVTPIPFRESTMWDGYPEETNAPYGIAKKMLLVQCQAYRRQYGMNAVYLLPVNLYGPRDNFEPESSHVIPALIRRCLEAKERGYSRVVCWGDGSASREFLYVTDAAEGLVLAAEYYDDGEPVNLGSGHEINIRTLAEIIAMLCGYDGELVWDSSRPNGQPRRCLDTSRAASSFGFNAQTSLETGLKATIEWYLHDGPISRVDQGGRRASLPLGDFTSGTRKE